MLSLWILSSYTNESSDLDRVTMHGVCGTVQVVLLSLAYAGFSVHCIIVDMRTCEIRTVSLLC